MSDDEAIDGSIPRDGEDFAEASRVSHAHSVNREVVELPAESRIALEESVLIHATTQAYFQTEQLSDSGLKDAHTLVIQDGTHESSLVHGGTSVSLIAPDSPRKYRYPWDGSAHDEVLPIRCITRNAQLHKSKFGSGGRGKCIFSRGRWLTPNEFESECGRARSKDWKRSIRYGGRTINCLIEDGFLQPHASACTCAACTDDVSATGPIRYFVPYKKRKLSSGPPTMVDSTKYKRLSTNPAVMSLSDGLTSHAHVPITAQPLSNADSSDEAATNSITIRGPSGGSEIITANGHRMIVSLPQGVSLPNLPQGVSTASKSHQPLSLDLVEERVWWQLEETANSLCQQAANFKAQIEQAKAASAMAREAAMQSLRRDLLHSNQHGNQHGDVNIEPDIQQGHHMPARREFRPRSTVVTGAGSVHHITREVVVGLGVDEDEREEEEEDEERKGSELEDQEDEGKVTSYSVAWSHTDEEGQEITSIIAGGSDSGVPATTLKKAKCNWKDSI